MQTRFGTGGHLLRIYEEGELVEERRLSSAKPIPKYYGLWLWHWHRELRRFARRHEGTVALFEHPLGGVGQVFRRKVKHVFWQWDYFPSGSFVDRLFNAVARHCARTCARYVPLTGAIARAMGVPDAKPVMLGVTPPTRFGDPNSNRILMVGQLRDGQGIEDVLDFLAAHKEYSLSLMGAAANGFEKTIAECIAAADMTDRIYFPNRFVTEDELRAEAAKCFVSLALYDTSPSNLTHYADPGKVKSSIEMGLPIVMTRISDIVSFVEKFKAGEVVDSLDALPAAVDRIRANYSHYQSGLRAFTEHFDCERYYADVLIAVNCNQSADLVSSAYADKFQSASNDERSVCGGVHPFAAAREQTVADLGRVRVLAQELSAELVRTVQHGEGASVREISEVVEKSDGSIASVL